MVDGEEWWLIPDIWVGTTTCDYGPHFCGQGSTIFQGLVYFKGWFYQSICKWAFYQAFYQSVNLGCKWTRPVSSNDVGSARFEKGFSSEICVLVLSMTMIHDTWGSSDNPRTSHSAQTAGVPICVHEMKHRRRWGYLDLGALLQSITMNFEVRAVIR